MTALFAATSARPPPASAFRLLHPDRAEPNDCRRQEHASTLRQSVGARAPAVKPGSRWYAFKYDLNTLHVGAGRRTCSSCRRFRFVVDRLKLLRWLVLLSSRSRAIQARR